MKWLARAVLYVVVYAFVLMVFAPAFHELPAWTVLMIALIVSGLFVASMYAVVWAMQVLDD